jgi:hypothetical protein
MKEKIKGRALTCLSTCHEHPRLTELAIFLSKKVDFVLHFHVVSRGEVPRQGVHLLSDKLFDRFSNAGEDRAKHLLLSLQFPPVLLSITLNMIAELRNQPFRLNVWLQKGQGFTNLRRVDMSLCLHSSAADSRVPRASKTVIELLLSQNASYPPHQHHQADNHRNQQECVGGFPNQYFADVHYGVQRRAIMQRVLVTHRIRFGRHSGR